MINPNAAWTTAKPAAVTAKPYAVCPIANCCRPSPAKGVPNTSGAVHAPRTKAMSGACRPLNTALRSGASRAAKRAGIPMYINTNNAMKGCVETHSSCS